MEEVYISNKDTGIPEDYPTKEKQNEIIGKLEDIKMLVTLPQDLSATASPTFAGLSLSNLTPSRLVFAGEGGGGLVSGVTDITAPELEELSSGSETTLHSHATAGACSMLTGVYTGDKVDNREIDVGVDLASKTYVYIIIKGLFTYKAVHRMEYSQGNYAMSYDGTNDTPQLIKGLTANGFIVSTSDVTNKVDTLHRYIIFWMD